MLAENIIPAKLNDDNLENLDIISNTQFNQENKFIAEGEVEITKNNMQLKSDKLVYDLEKIITLTGEITFISDEQFFQATEIKYNLIDKEGYIKDVYGTINFDTLDSINNKLNSEYSNFSEFNSSIKDVKLNKSSSLEFDDITAPQNLKIDINQMTKWRFQSKEIKIKETIWSSEILYLTNDPYNNPQIVIKNSKFKSFEKNEIILLNLSGAPSFWKTN